MKKDNNKISFYKKYRIFTITLIMFLVVLPIITIPSIYISHFVSSKDVLFGDKTLKAQTLDSQDKFIIEANLIEIIKQDKENDNNGKYLFEIDFKTESSNIKDFKIEAQLSVKNDNYNSEVISKTVTNHSKTKFEIVFNYDMNKNPLLFVSPKGPTLYLRITYSFVESNLGTPKPIIVKVPFPIPPKN